MGIVTKLKGKDDEIVFEVAGEIDNSAAESLLAEMNKVIQMQPQRVTVDLSRVTSMGSAGIGKLLYFYKELTKRHVVFEIRGMPSSLYAIFTSLKLDKLFPIAMA